GLAHVARPHPHPVPSGARAERRHHPGADRRGHALSLGPPLPAHLRVPVRPRQLCAARDPARDRRRRPRAGPERRRDRRAPGGVRDLPAGRVAALPDRPAPPLDADDPLDRARGLDGQRRVPRPAERVRAGRGHPAPGDAMPMTDSVVVGYRIAVTPDRLLGRVEAVRSSIALAIAPLGPLVAGFLLEKISARETIAFFCLFNVVLLVWGVLSPAIRRAPSLSDLATAEGWMIDR